MRLYDQGSYTNQLLFLIPPVVRSRGEKQKLKPR